MNWDLTSYFPSCESPERVSFKEAIERDLEGLQKRCAALAVLSAENAPAWEQIFLEVEDLYQRLSHLGSYLGCLTAADSIHEGYKAEEAAFAAVRAEAEKLEVDLKRGLGEASDEDFAVFVQRVGLSDCSHYLNRLREDAQRVMTPPEERLAADLGVDGIHAWGRLYETLSGRLEFDMVDPDGRAERLPIAQRRSREGSNGRA